MTQRFDTAAIIGVGLLGSSLGLALKARGLVGAVRGVGHRQVSLDTALGVGAIDTAYLNAGEAVDGADLIVICTPANLVCSVLDEIRPVCSAEAVITDVASTKVDVCAHARATWPTPSRFVGSHPMAGSEKFGPEHGYPELYEGCVTMVELGEHLDAEAQRTVANLWRSVGATVVEMEPAQHDTIVARTSHIPHVVAAALAALATQNGAVSLDKIRPLVGPGFRDVTRIAGSRPEIWRDICLTNQAPIVAGLGEFLAQMHAIRDAIAQGRAEAIEAFFQQGRDARQKTVEP